MTDSLSPNGTEALKRRDAIMSAIAHAAERFLWASAATWPQTVQEVIAQLGESLHIRRIFLCKHQEVTATYVITGLRYEWVATGVMAKINQTSLQRINLQEAGFGRWAGILYGDKIIQSQVDELPPGERGWFLSDTASSIIVVPVFVGSQWWGFIGFEDYAEGQTGSQAELDAFKSVAVTFGAAIQRKRTEEALERAKVKVEEKVREAEVLAKAQSDFISMASHQLRSPLTSVRWYSERLLKHRETLEDKQVESAEVIHKTAVQLAAIVDDLLNLSRMEQGSVAVTLSMGDIHQLIDEVVTELLPQAEQKQIKITRQKDTAVRPINLDEKLVSQVLLNLVSNAIKYTDNGGQVTIKTTWVPEAYIKVEVADNGIGIPQAEQGRIFDRFYRSAKAIDLKVEGTGLGLSVAKMMVEEWGGTIGFTSAEGQGSIFYCTIPIQYSQT